MAQLSMKAVEELYSNLIILQFWKDKPQTSLIEYVDCCRREVRKDKSAIFLEILQFLIRLNANSKELRSKGLTRLPCSPIEHREFIQNTLEFFSTTFPELHLSKSSFTGNKFLETLRVISIRTLANLCKQRDVCFEHAGSKYNEEIRLRSLKLLIANEVRKHQLLKTASQQRRKQLLKLMQNIREYLESIIVQYDNMKASDGMCSELEFFVRENEQVVHLMLTWITKLTETLSNVSTSHCTFLDSPLPLKSANLKRYQTWVDRNVFRLISCGEEIAQDTFSESASISPRDQEASAIQSAIYNFIRKTESILSESS